MAMALRARVGSRIKMESSEMVWLSYERGDGRFHPSTYRMRQLWRSLRQLAACLTELSEESLGEIDSFL